MKKNLLGFAAFALILTSCQENEIIEHIDDGNNQLEFGVYQGKVTKTAELTNEALKDPATRATVDNPIDLYAYKGKQSGAKTLYFNEALYYNGTIWRTKLIRFLADTDPLQFYAYYPKTTTDVTTTYAHPKQTTPPEYDADVFPTLTYTIATPEKQVDLVAAKVNDNVGNKVMIPLRHILSQVNFGVKGYEGARIYIRNISIKNVINNGVFDFGADWDWSHASSPTIAAEYGYAFAGKVAGVTSTYQTPGTIKDGNDGDNTYIFGDGGKAGPGKTKTTIYVTDINPIDTICGDRYAALPMAEKLSNSLMLMPQELKEGVVDAIATFEYKISDMGTPAAWVVGGAGNVAGTDWIAGTFDLNFTTDDPKNKYEGKWDPNFRYVYIIDFTDYLNGKKLTFDVDVDLQPWENYNGEDDDDGVVLLSATGEPVFANSISVLKPGEMYTIPRSQALSDIKWNWSPYTMKNSNFTAAGQIFTVDFSKVKFNTHKITVTAPKGFEVDKSGVVDGTTGKTSLVFKSLAAPATPATAGATKDGKISAAPGALYNATTWTLAAPTTALGLGESFTVDASEVWLNGHKLTVTAPASYKTSGTYPEYKITKE